MSLDGQINKRAQELIALRDQRLKNQKEDEINRRNNLIERRTLLQVLIGKK